MKRVNELEEEKRRFYPSFERGFLVDEWRSSWEDEWVFFFDEEFVFESEERLWD